MKRVTGLALFVSIMLGSMALGAVPAAANGLGAGLNRATGGGIRGATSANWAGYAATRATFTKVSGKWVQPAGRCPNSGTQYAVFWVGLDGYNSGTVEQTGTLIQCRNGQAAYAAWWEMFPRNAVQVIPSINVRPGDRFSASVTYTGGKFRLKITNQSTRQSFTTNQSCGGCRRSSAEWIAEAPSGGGGSIFPLVDFNKWKLTAGRATAGGHTGAIRDSHWNDVAITMVTSGGAVKAKPGPLNAAGDSFTVTWHHA
jgi:Peptidase A4 family